VLVQENILKTTIAILNCEGECAVPITFYSVSEGPNAIPTNFCNGSSKFIAILHSEGAQPAPTIFFNEPHRLIAGFTPIINSGEVFYIDESIPIPHFWGAGASSSMLIVGCSYSKTSLICCNN
jgi:hypothetical protein